MAVQNSAVVVKPLQFAWLEFQDVRDGVVFCHTMADRLGAKNIFGNLPVDPADKSKRKPKNTPALDIDFVVRSHHSGAKTKYQALIGYPRSKSAKFLGQWVLNPGFLNGELVVSNTAEQADIVTVSGHGSAGIVWGNGYASAQDQAFFLGSALSNNVKMARSGRMKMLIIPACYNGTFDAYEIWEKCFTRSEPLYWIFGYEKTYTGGEVGAQVMNEFTRYIKANPQKPLLDAWHTANKKYAQHWGAFILKGAEKISYSDWVSGKLPKLGSSTDVVHYGEGKPTGVKAVANADPYRLRFLFSDRTVVNSGNNYMLYLIPGNTGWIRIECEPGTPDLKQGDVIHLYTFLVRPDHAGAKMDKIFEFDSSLTAVNAVTKKPVVEFLVNDNPWMKAKGAANPDAGIKNGLRVVVPANTRSLELKFTVKSGLAAHFKKDGPENNNGEKSYGNFILGMFLPNQTPVVTPAGARVRTPVYSYLQYQLLCEP